MTFTKPKDAEFEWTPAVRPQNKYYKFDLDKDKWLVYSEMFQVWRISLNDSAWYCSEIAQGYFVPIPGKTLLTTDNTTATVASIQQKE